MHFLFYFLFFLLIPGPFLYLLSQYPIPRKKTYTQTHTHISVCLIAVSYSCFFITCNLIKVFICGDVFHFYRVACWNVIITNCWWFCCCKITLIHLIDILATMTNLSNISAICAVKRWLMIVFLYLCTHMVYEALKSLCRVKLHV